MPSTYVNDLRLEEIATGEQSGTWGVTTNTNLELVAEAFAYGTVDPFDTDADKTETMADGATDPIRSLYLKVTSTATLTATRTLTLAPNTVSKVWIIENATTGGQSITISQGSGSNVTISNGDVKAIYTDGAGATAAVTDAFANLKVTDPAQTNITSVGTLTSLTVSGDLTVDTSTLKVDSANNRVGIGTASPSQKLEVTSSTSTSIGRFTNSSGNVLHAGVVGVGEVGLQTFGGSTNMTFYTNSTERLRIDSSGNVGIGNTPNATFKLDVEGSVRTNGSGFYVSPNYSSGNNVYKIYDNSNEFRIESQIFGNANVASSPIVFGTSNTDGRLARMTITSSGNVGIGTSSPNQLLEVAKSSGGATINISTDQAAGSTASKLYTNLDFSGYNNNVMARIQSWDESTSTGYGYLTFHTNNGTSLTERMRIASDGTVMVGTTSSSYGAKLAIQSTTSYTFNSKRTGTGSEGHIVFENGNGAVGSIFTNASATSYNTSSDARLKDVTGSARGLEVINALNPVAFNWKADGHADEGLLAQEVLEIVPNAVSGSEEEYYQMDYSKLVTHLIAGMKEQQVLIEQLQAEVALLKGE